MQSADLGLLVSLDALLREESVSRAARRMHVTAPAMSRTLGRLREVLGDPLLVRAGRQLVPTPRALRLRDRVRAAVEEGHALLSAGDALSLDRVDRTFALRASEAFVGPFAARLCERAQADVPGLRLRFVAEGDEEVGALREGAVHLELGVIGPTGPEIRVQALFRDRFVAVVRRNHPLAEGRVTAKRFVSFPHVSVSRRGRPQGPIDEALDALGLARRIELVVPAHQGAIVAALASNLVASVPARVAASLQPFLSLRTLALPVRVPSITVSQAWHPRFDADTAHRWLRQTIREIAGRKTATP